MANAFLSSVSIMPLETRFMFDGAAAADVASTDSDSGNDAAKQAAEAAAAAVDSSSTSDQEQAAGAVEADGDAAGVQVVLISSNVADQADLATAVKDGVVAVTLGADDDLDAILSSIKDAVGDQQIDSLALASHSYGDAIFGLTGSLKVDMASLTTDAEMQAFWRDLGAMVADSGRIDLLACDLADSDLGLATLAYVSQLTGVEVAASDDATGNAADGGDWVLEYGQQDGAAYFDVDKLAEFDGVLADASLITDINPSGDSYPNYFQVIGNDIYFIASDGTHGNELWTYDTTGASGAATMVADLRPGSGYGVNDHIITVGTTIYFNGSDGTEFSELWKYDTTGASGGPSLVFKIDGATSFNPNYFCAVGTDLYFSAQDGVNGSELWKYDTTGASGDPTMVADINPGAGYSNINAIIAVGTDLYFAGEGDSAQGHELWKYDTVGDTVSLVADIYSGSSDSYPGEFYAVGTKLFFRATGINTQGQELWMYDTTGVSGAPSLVMDINPTASTGASISNFVSVGTDLYFSANDGTNGSELWKYDTTGASGNPTRLTDINPGAGSAGAYDMIVDGTDLYFRASDGVNGEELWKYDTLTNTASLEADINAGAGVGFPRNLVYVNNRIILAANNGTNGVELMEFVLNQTPAVSVDSSSLAYMEHNTATQIDPTLTISDADDGAFGNVEWDGGTLVVQVTSDSRTGDTLTIPDNVVGSINTDGTNILNGSTVIGTLSASEGTVTGSTALTITFNANATNALVQQVARAVHYHSTSDDVGTTRTITFTATDKKGGSASDARTLAVTDINDEPGMTATGSNPTFTEDGANAALFSGSNINVIETGQNVGGIGLTVTNVLDAGMESLVIDGTEVALTNGNSGSTAANSFGYAVSLSGTTATVTITKSDTVANYNTMVNGLAYKNASQAPTTTSTRVATIVSLQDAGGTANSGDDTSQPLTIASTVTVASAVDAPTVNLDGDDSSGAGGNNYSTTFGVGGGGVAIADTDSALTALDTNGSLGNVTVVLSGVLDGAAESISIDGVSSGDVVGGVTVTYVSATQITLSGVASTSAYSAVLESIKYNNSDASATAGNRTVTVQSNDGSTSSANATTTVAVVNAPLVDLNGTGSGSGNTVNWTEGGSAVSVVDAAATLTDTDSANLDQMVIQLTNAVAGDVIALTGRNNGDVVNGITITYDSSSQITLSGLSAIANYQALMREVTYDNTAGSDAPDQTARTITFAPRDTEGNTAAAVTATVNIVDVNDEPTLTATGSNPTFTEDGAAASLFSGATIDAIEASQNLASLTLTVANLADGASELLVIDGTEVALTAGASGTTTANSFGFSVSVSATTATVTITKSDTVTNYQTMINGLAYKNASDAPSVGTDRVVTLTQLQDAGGTANSGDDTNDALAITSTVSLTAVNDAPTATTIEKTVRTNLTLSFTAADFTTAFSDVDGDSLTKIRITALPMTGVLSLGGVPAVLNAEINTADLGTLTFTSTTPGDDGFSWQGHDGTVYAAASADTFITVERPPVSAPPVTAPTPTPTPVTTPTVTPTTTTTPTTVVTQATDVGLVQARATDTGTQTVSSVSAASFVTPVAQPTTDAVRDGTLFVNKGIPSVDMTSSSLVFNVPLDAFGHTDKSDSVQLTARMADGSQLPNWISFDSTSGTFVGEVPPGVSGEIAIVVSARDQAGQEVSTIFKINLAAGGQPVQSQGDAPAGEVDGQQQSERNVPGNQAELNHKDARPVVKGRASFAEQLSKASLFKAKPSQAA